MKIQRKEKMMVLKMNFSWASHFLRIEDDSEEGAPLSHMAEFAGDFVDQNRLHSDCEIETQGKRLSMMKPPF